MKNTPNETPKTNKNYEVIINEIDSLSGEQMTSKNSYETLQEAKTDYEKSVNDYLTEYNDTQVILLSSIDRSENMEWKNYD